MSQARTLPPGAERRRQLRLQRRRERLRNAWRLLVLLGIAGGLGYGLLREGWTLTGPDQVQVVGSRLVTPDRVIEAAGLTFPQPLLGLQPRKLAADLAETLPVEEVHVSRLMAPPRLRVSLVDRQAVARAQRRTGQGVERGYVDRLGHWMNSSQGDLMAGEATAALLVKGWQPRHRASLTRVLEQRSRFGNDLQEIRFEPEGSLWLRSATLGQVRLGPADAQLTRRLQVLDHLVETLPAQLKGQRLRSLDLSDPEQPELVLVGSKSPGTPPRAP
ncbi:cell division protein FtsQ/DivIB [Cyanobium sp. NIES-981]|uniref:cell division protein FtsQ/DivIB n=1 Tax=Cyanobium sp. NIES-981 TaxID=1851505 RepID=UPI0007DD3937|nr:FtsQ-type POTRA domain-containing protein [Cyanobium sp. NIES-981]SBO43068.1 Cell division protein FtsQ [Cyanobium sp. NIES-981]